MRKDGKSQYQLYKERYNYQVEIIDQIDYWIDQVGEIGQTKCLERIKSCIKLSQRTRQ